MITINIVCVGNLKEKFWSEAEKEYLKRLSRFCKVVVKEVEEQNKYEVVDKIISVEGEKILSALEGKSILLDIQGKELTSEQFASKIKDISLKSSSITFVIGGSYGVSSDVKRKIEDKVSFGKVTYPHNLARIILLEQIYRAFMINSNSKYHK